MQTNPIPKWVTDISYIQTGQGVLYLSMIRDLYDNSIVAYKTATHQTVTLVLDTIRLAMRKEKKRAAAELQLHSDQGGQYTSHEYFDLTKRYGITPSMSRRGNCYDNAMAENFFSILKTECLYRQKIATFQQAKKCQRQFEIVRKRRRNFVVFRRGGNKNQVLPCSKSVLTICCFWRINSLRSLRR